MKIAILLVTFFLSACGVAESQERGNSEPRKYFDPEYGVVCYFSRVGGVSCVKVH